MTIDRAMTVIEISEITEIEGRTGTRDMEAIEIEIELTEEMTIGTLTRVREIITGPEADQAAETIEDTSIGGTDEIIGDLEIGTMVETEGGMVETEASVIEARKLSNMKMMATRIQI